MFFGWYRAARRASSKVWSAEPFVFTSSSIDVRSCPARSRSPRSFRSAATSKNRPRSSFHAPWTTSSAQSSSTFVKSRARAALRIRFLSCSSTTVFFFCLLANLCSQKSAGAQPADEVLEGRLDRGPVLGFDRDEDVVARGHGVLVSSG